VTSGGAKKGLNGLVLAGGKSERMGEDKGMLNWHGRPQRYYVADLLVHFCDQVFISCREDQVSDVDAAYATITDKYSVGGPMAGILSAMDADGTAAWLVVACDLPLIDEHTIQYLVQHRNRETIATTFRSPFDQLPEPLITIWEPTSKAALLQKIEAGYRCPRKVLINSNATVLPAPDDNALINANTPEDAAAARNMIAQKTTV